MALGRLAGTTADAPATQASRALQHVSRYRALVDRRFREQPTLTALASDIGITPS
ncbi:MAG TPA: hypothetical protein VFP68_09800 [Burkholderiaceae bacterium]|nr:hypothetical protein [Burkholderiaceae bacterium]